MRIEKKVLGQLDKVYATAIMPLNGELHYVVAAEGETECRAINVVTGKETLVWDSPGGTMNIIPVPGRENEFIATQKFIPTFNASESRIVHAKVDINNQWTVTPIMTIPYLHRFDLLMIEGHLHLIGGILCATKAFKDDWSDPGKIIIGRFNESITEPFEVKAIYEGITKHHGFCSSKWNNKKAYFLTGVEGMFIVTPPEILNGQWLVEQLFDHEISDCALCDIDGDGELEIATIELFHGDKGKIYKKISGEWQVIHEHSYEFGHVVWGGQLAGEPAFIIGGRKGAMEIIVYTMKEGKVMEQIIDNTGGASNIAVYHIKDKDLILAANRQIGEYAVYEVYKD